jgi:hypothetical protein
MRKRAIIIPATILAIATPATVITAKHLDTSSTAPVLKSTAEDWSKTASVSIATAATFGGSDLDHYEYCISNTDNIDDCDWKISSVETVRVRNLGTSYIWMRGVSKYGVVSSISDYVLTRVDRNKPDASAVDEVTTSSITVTVTATDDSGIKSYEYAIGDSAYVTDGASHVFDGLASGTTYVIKVRITDLAGNAKVLSYSQSTSSPAVTRSSRTSGNISFANMPSGERPSGFPGGGKGGKPAERPSEGDSEAPEGQEEPPEQPEQSEQLNEEENPAEQPENPEQPQGPQQPEQPQQPDCLTEPEQPQKPERPERPVDGEEGEEPAEPEKPERPNLPLCQDQPEQPQQPQEPEQPKQPEQPENQEAPEESPSENNDSASTEEPPIVNQPENNDDSDAIENSEQTPADDTILGNPDPSENTSAIAK